MGSRVGDDVGNGVGVLEVGSVVGDDVGNGIGLSEVGNENLIPLKEPSDKTRMLRTLLKGQALSYFEQLL
jgi:hypothetical protein